MRGAAAVTFIVADIFFLLKTRARPLGACGTKSFCLCDHDAAAVAADDDDNADAAVLL